MKTPIKQRRAQLDAPVTVDLVPVFARSAILFDELADLMRGYVSDGAGTLTVKDVVENAVFNAASRLANVDDDVYMVFETEADRVWHTAEQVLADVVYAGHILHYFQLAHKRGATFGKGVTT